jgi:hypothetical protein
MHVTMPRILKMTPISPARMEKYSDLSIGKKMGHVCITMFLEVPPIRLNLKMFFMESPDRAGMTVPGPGRGRPPASQRVNHYDASREEIL